MMLTTEERLNAILETLPSLLSSERYVVLQHLREAEADGFRRGYMAASHAIEDSLRAHGLAKTLREIREKPDAE